MLILGIETSCDETAVALYDTTHGLLGEQVYSQIKLHQQHGGVVPELASRDHIRKLLPLIKTLLQACNVSLSNLTAVGYTAGPGLIGALLTGAVLGHSLAFALNIPAIPVHHLEAHLLAAQIDMPTLDFPFLTLLVSGGHTMLIQANQLGAYQILGETVDDAIGEAFDKTAKLLGLAYPGGPAIAQVAIQGDANHFIFPRPMTDRPGLNFSFSGLKTHVLNKWLTSDRSEQTKADIAASFQAAAVDTLLIKCKRAIKQTGIKCLVVAGGVAANQLLRQRLHESIQALQGEVFFPEIKRCTDNAAMVAYCAALRLEKNLVANSLAIEVKPRWPLTELSFK